MRRLSRRSGSGVTRPISNSAATSCLSCCSRGTTKAGHDQTTNVRDELVTLLFAGHETTATSLAWALRSAAAPPPGTEQPGRGAGRRCVGVPWTPRSWRRCGSGRWSRSWIAKCARPSDRQAHDPRRSDRVAPTSTSSSGARIFTRTLPAFRPDRFRRPDAPAFGWFPFGGGIRRA